MIDKEYREYLRQTKKQMLWMCRTYPYHKMKYEEILHSSPSPADGQPSAHYPHDIIGDMAVKLAAHGEVIHPIEDAILEVPEYYRKAVWEHCVFGAAGYPASADRKTFYKWQERFLLAIMRRRHLL
jgi:hypothetical protein